MSFTSVLMLEMPKAKISPTSWSCNVLFIFFLQLKTDSTWQHVFTGVRASSSWFLFIFSETFVQSVASDDFSHSVSFPSCPFLMKWPQYILRSCTVREDTWGEGCRSPCSWTVMLSDVLPMPYCPWEYNTNTHANTLQKQQVACWEFLSRVKKTLTIDYIDC